MSNPVNLPFDPYVEWLGISTTQRPPDYYTLLGLHSTRASSEEVERAFATALARVRVYQVGARSAVALKLVDELSAAFRVLGNVDQRREYDRQRQIADPWVRIAARIDEYIAGGDEAALEEAKRQAELLTPGEGRVYVARYALEQGCSEPRFRKTLAEHAAQINKSACQNCFTFFDAPAAPEPLAMTLTTEALESAALNIVVTNDVWSREARISGLEWHSGHALHSVDRQLVAALMWLGMMVIAGLLWANAQPAVKSMSGMAIITVGVSLVAVWIHRAYRPEFECAADVAWSVVVPRLLRSPPSSDQCGFLAALAKCSIGQGSREKRRVVLKQALQYAAEWARNRETTLDPLIKLQRLVLHDSLRRHDSQRALASALQDLLSQCLQGNLPLSVFDQVTDGGRLLSTLNKPEHARVALHFLAQCRERWLTVADVFQLTKYSKAVDCLLARKRYTPESVAWLFALDGPRRTASLSKAPSTAFDLAARGSGRPFESWPDLILHSNHRSLLLCARGVHFEGIFFTSQPKIRELGTGDQRWLLVNHHRFFVHELNPETSMRLREFCGFCFGPLEAYAAPHLARSPTAGLWESLFSTLVTCPRCGKDTPIVPRETNATQNRPTTEI